MKGGTSHGKKRKGQINKKGASSTLILVVVLILFIFLTSTQKVEINDKQIKTATPTSCNLIKEVYDPMLKLCIPISQQQNGTGGP